MLDFKGIAKKWQDKWEEKKIFEVEINDKPKYYIAIVYPYMSGLLHLGHLFTYTVPEVVMRYKRMKGFNVLSKFAFHCTGTPIVAAAKKVAEGEEGQINSLKKMGIADGEISKFSDPEYWCDYFPDETIKDVKNMGFALDYRYVFRTTSLNPPYDAMIRWQFNKLKEGGYVKKGKHPVVWCPKDKLPVGDHDRAEGEGETPQEFTLLKFKMKDDSYLVAATLRPETVFGQTNMWIDPDYEYLRLKVDDEVWIVSDECKTKLLNQDKKVEELGKVKGADLVGQYCLAPGLNKEIIILPSEFCDPNIGTGIVTSVPSHAPFDWMGVFDLQSNKKLCEKYGLDFEEVKKIEPISLIKIDNYGEHPAQDICKEMKIKSQKDFDKLEKAKKEIYKLEHFTGIMKDVAGKYKGMKVEDAKRQIKQELIDEKKADLFFEMTGKVICRCLTECVIKTVSDQWFLEYNDPKWKKLAHECLDSMKIYPEKVRKQFDYVLDWLDHWACTREFGLGTKLPWDEKWVIESLSDSTIQMAYNTISKYLQNPDSYGFSVDKLNDEFFDYVFLAKGNVEDVEKSTGIPKDKIDIMKRDFEYWYPFDFRNSAKDLLQNHLSFCIFNHTALFPKKYWPKAFVVNGRIMVNNEKMSKSKGNFFTMRELYEKHGADIVRLTSLNAGEGVEDANYDMTFLETAKKKLSDLHEFVSSNYDKGRDEELGIDKWFESVIHDTIKKTEDSMEGMLFKSAVQHSLLDLTRNLKWYMNRTKNNPSKRIINFYVETQLKLLSPFIPHFCEEAWEKIGKEGFVSQESFPQFDEGLIKEDMNYREEFVRDTSRDIREVLRLVKVDKPKVIKLFVSQNWRYDLFLKVHELVKSSNNPKEVLKEVLSDEKFKVYSKDISKFLPKMVGSRKIPLVKLSKQDELDTLNEAKDYLKGDFDCEIEVIDADSSSENKAKQANPMKAAILVE